MTTRCTCDDDAYARLVEVVSGRAAEREREDVLAHAVGCDACGAELERLRAVAEELRRAPRPSPRADVWSRISARVAEDVRSAESVQPWKGWDGALPAATDEVVRRAADSAWNATGVAGIEVRRLSTDPDSASVTMLVRMAPGARFPAHEHGGPEECYVLEGDLQVGDELEMRAGDFQRCETGSRHPEQWTRGGCLLFLRSSTRDTLLSA